jgi:hypothetical protein
MAPLYSINGGSQSRPPSDDEVRQLEADACRALSRLLEVIPADDWRRMPTAAVAAILKPRRQLCERGGA